MFLTHLCLHIFNDLYHHEFYKGSIWYMLQGELHSYLLLFELSNVIANILFVFVPFLGH